MSSQRFCRVLHRIFRGTIVSDVVQGIVVGGGLAIVTAQFLMNAYGLAK